MEGRDVNAVAKDDAVEGLALMTSGKVQHKPNFPKTDNNSANSISLHSELNNQIVGIFLVS